MGDRLMPRAGRKLAMTPAAFRQHARQHISRFDGMDRERAARAFLEEMITSTEVRFSLAQMRAGVEGLRLGMDEGVR